MDILCVRDRIAAALGLAVVACEPAPPPVVVAPVSTTPTQADAAPPKPPGKVVDLPKVPPCHEAIRYQCEKPLSPGPDEHYASPFENCRVSPNFSGPRTTSQRASVADTCCYVTCSPMEFEGRPLRAADESIRLAKPTLRDDWQARVTELAVSPSPERSARWLTAAMAEHASVAAFSQISLQLLALGAPPSLIEGTHRAALDEIRHAQITFALANAYGDGTIFGPSALSLDGITLNRTLRGVVVDALVDGCIGEAASAIAMADDAVGPAKELIESIVTDEESHATLAWQVVRWGLSCEPGLASELTMTLDRIGRGSGLEARVATDVAAPILRALMQEQAPTPERPQRGPWGNAD